MNMIWLLRAAKWARNPPSEKRVRFVLGIIIICLLLFGVERLIGWPEWLTPSGNPRGRIIPP